MSNSQQIPRTWAAGASAARRRLSGLGFRRLHGGALTGLMENPKELLASGKGGPNCAGSGSGIADGYGS
jgi:hypothetical protein